MTDHDKVPPITDEERAYWFTGIVPERFRNGVTVEYLLLTSSFDARLRQLEAENERLKNALNERNLFANPDIMEQWANEIDCCPSCESCSTEYDTNFTMCHKSDRGEYCPNDLAETLRAVAKVARAALKEEA